MKSNYLKLMGLMLGAAVLWTAPAVVYAAGGWEMDEDGNEYWYENGEKQGLEGRGKEIYDEGTDAWYWLDSGENGRKAVDKDVYQESYAGPYADREDGTGKWCRYDENGRMIKGEDYRYGGWYRFDEETGAMVKGWYIDGDGKVYYYNWDNGQKVFGEYEVDGIPCYFDEVTGAGADCCWIVIDGNEYWYENGMRQGLEGRGKEIFDQTSNAWYWLDSVDMGKKAVSKDVFQESQADDDGTIGKWVRYDAEGHMVKGWNEKDGSRYYFNPVYGTMAKGIVDIDGKMYSFDEASGIYLGRANVSYGVGAEYHTQEEIRNYMADSGADWDNPTKMKTASSLSAPYAAGSLTDDSLNDALAMFNQIRYIAGISYNVTLNDGYTELAQAGAFLNAVNRVLSHSPRRPAGMEDELYKAGQTGASRSNLAYTSWKSTLSYALNLWMDDSDSSNIDKIGHRRWILNPSMKQTGFGYALSSMGTCYTSMYVFDYGKTDVRGVAWPAREMPVDYFDAQTAWSYSYGESLSDITVKLSCQNEGSSQVWNFSEGTADGYFNVENSNYGQKGCVIFKPDGIEIKAGDQYLVTIMQGDALLAEYTVNFF